MSYPLVLAEVIVGLGVLPFVDGLVPLFGVTIGGNRLFCYSHAIASFKTKVGTTSGLQITAVVLLENTTRIALCVQGFQLWPARASDDHTHVRTDQLFDEMEDRRSDERSQRRTVDDTFLHLSR